MKSTTKPPTAPADDATKERPHPPGEANVIAKESWVRKTPLRTKLEGAAVPTKGAHECAVTAEQSRPSRVDVAMLATLMAINHSIQRPDEKREPKDFLSGAQALLSEAERSESHRVVAESMNKLSRLHRRPDDILGGEYSWREVLAVQKQAASGKSSLTRLVSGAPAENIGGRIPVPKPFGPVVFRHDDLVNRPVGISMVGSIGTEKGLRIAIKRLFNPEQAKQIINGKTLTLRQINALLQDHLRIHHGRIPKGRAKSNQA